MKARKENFAIWVLLAIMAVGSGFMDYFLPAFGDDLSFWTILGLDDYNVPDRRSISFIIAHIEGCNGRLFDYMGPVVVDFLPRLIQAILMGAMAGLYFFSMLLSSKQKKGCFPALFLAITLAVMPWWDMMLLRVCQFNYLWGTTFCLLFFRFFFHGKEQYGKLTQAGLFMLSIFAGSAHEQTGVAMCAAMFGYALLKKRYQQFSKPQLWMMLGLLFGTFLTISSPAIWQRFAQESFHFPILKLILTTLPVYILLLSIILVLNKRLKFKAEDWTMFLAASLAAIIAVMSGIPGRTGWFTESISLILLSRILLEYKVNIRKSISATIYGICLCFICSHYTAAAIYQVRAYADHEEMRKQFIASENGVVYLDYLHRNDQPLLSLYRVRGVYPPYDKWSATVLSRAYSNGNKQLLVLPAAFKNKEIKDSLTIGNVTIYRNESPNTFITQDSTLIQQWNGHKRIVLKGPDFEAAIPFEIEPGDMLTPIIGQR